MAPSHAVPCCPYFPVLVPSNSEFVVGAWSAHMKVVITGKLGMACKVSKVNTQLSLSRIKQGEYLGQYLKLDNAFEWLIFKFMPISNIPLGFPTKSI